MGLRQLIIELMGLRLFFKLLGHGKLIKLLRFGKLRKLLEQFVLLLVIIELFIFILIVFIFILLLLFKQRLSHGHKKRIKHAPFLARGDFCSAIYVLPQR